MQVIRGPPAFPPGNFSKPAQVVNDVPVVSEPQAASTHLQPTSVMLRNIPNDYTRDMVCKLLDQEGFQAKYDFLYVPIDFMSGSARGYAFVNFVSHSDAQAFLACFAGFHRWAYPSRKV